MLQTFTLFCLHYILVIQACVYTQFTFDYNKAKDTFNLYNDRTEMHKTDWGTTVGSYKLNSDIPFDQCTSLDIDYANA